MRASADHGSIDTARLVGLDGRHVIGADWHARRIVDIDDREPLALLAPQRSRRSFRRIAGIGCAGPRGSLNDGPASILLGEANVKGAAQTKSAHWGTAADA
jgi:hypothetical protein